MIKFRTEGGHLVRRLVLAALLLSCSPAVLAAQTEGWIGVGASLTHFVPVDDDLSGRPGVGLFVRLGQRGDGWAPMLGFGWFSADLAAPFLGARPTVARLRFRPFLAGVGHAWVHDPFVTEVTLAGGYSFNSGRVDADFDRLAASRGVTARIDVANAFVLRPAVTSTLTVAERVGVTGSVGYVIMRPDIRFVAPPAVYTDRWRTDTFYVSVGIVYSLF
jgi:hypothetical protein